MTVLTLVSASGFGPGAAMGETPAQLRLAEQAADREGAPSGSVSAREASKPRALMWVAFEEASQLLDPSFGPGEGTGGTGPTGSGSDGPDPDGSDDAGPDNVESTAVPPRSGQGERVVYDLSAQRVWLVDADDAATRTYLVSGSKREGLLEPGRYHVYSKSRHAVAFNYETTMNYMVRFATGKRWPIGFHDIPAFEDGTLAQSRSDLGTPQSAGCIRQWIADAKALWEFSEVGTLVVVVA